MGDHQPDHGDKYDKNWLRAVPMRLKYIYIRKSLNKYEADFLSVLFVSWCMVLHQSGG